MVAQRRLDVEVRGRAGDLLQRVLVVAQLAERAREALRVARDLGGRRVRQVLAPAGQRHLQERGADRGQDQRRDADDGADRAEAAVAPPPAAEQRHPHDDVRDQRDDADQHRRQAHQPHVAVADVGDLVRHHALELAPVEQRQQAGGGRDVGVLRVAAGGEGVGRHVVDDVDVGRLRQAGADRGVLHGAVQLGLLGLRHRVRAGRGGDDLARAEVREDAVGDRRDADDAGDARVVQARDAHDQRGDQEAEAQQDDARPQAIRADLLLERHRDTRTGSRSASSSMR